MLLALSAQANNHTIVILGTNGTRPDKTEVTSNSGSNSTDTLTVRPARDASIIYVYLKWSNFCY